MCLVFSRCIGRRLYVFGGENIPRVPVDRALHIFDLDTRIWTSSPSSDAIPWPSGYKVGLGF
jgi:hypothetical protein